MPFDEEGQKWACMPCIRGHRTAKCEHWDRWMVRVKRPGRPLTRCPHAQRARCECVDERVMMVEIRRCENGSCLCVPMKSQPNLPSVEDAPAYNQHTGELLGNQVASPGQTHQQQPALQPAPQPEQYHSYDQSSMSRFTPPASTGIQHSHLPNGGPSYPHSHTHGSHSGHHHNPPYPPPNPSHNHFPTASLSDVYPWTFAPIQVSGCDHADPSVHAYAQYPGANYFDAPLPILKPSLGNGPSPEDPTFPPPFPMPGRTHSHLIREPTCDPRQHMQPEGGRTHSPEFPTGSCCAANGPITSTTPVPRCDCAEDNCHCEFCPQHPDTVETRARIGELIGHMNPQDIHSFNNATESLEPFATGTSAQQFSSYPAQRAPTFSEQPDARYEYLVKFDDPCTKENGCSCGDRCRCPDCGVHNPRVSV